MTEQQFMESEKRHQELQEMILALMPRLLKAALGEDRHEVTTAVADATDAESRAGYRDNVISIRRAQSARDERSKVQAFKKLDGMTGEEIALLRQSLAPHKRSAFGRLFDMYCEWKANKGK